MVLILVPSSYFLYLEEDTNYKFVLFCTALAAAATAVIDSCVIAFSAHYPQHMQSSFQMGIGFSTLIGSVYRVLTKLLFSPTQVVESSLLYFYSGIPKSPKRTRSVQFNHANTRVYPNRRRSYHSPMYFLLFRVIATTYFEGMPARLEMQRRW